MKNAVQLNAKIKNIAQEKGLKHEVVLRNFMLERVLERISQSEYRTHFIIKGGLLISSMVGLATRTTMDLDASLTGKTLSEEEIVPIIKAIIEVPVDDNIIFAYKGIESIKEAGDYPGYRITLQANLERTRQMVKIDIATGDTITPKEIEYAYPMMFEDRSLPIMAYNLETVLAEKYETAISRSVLNTRMRDFYDIYLLQKTLNVDGVQFNLAFNATSSKRGTFKPKDERHKVVDTIMNDEAMIGKWSQYQRKYEYAKSVQWNEINEAIEDLEDHLN